jgi:hypothetical protein
MYNYDNKMFRGLSNSDNGEVSSETVFHYHQQSNVLSGTYSGGEIARGELLGVVRDDGSLDFFYHHINTAGELMAGRCHSVPERDSEGRIVLRESWQWLSGDRSSGESLVREVES